MSIDPNTFDVDNLTEAQFASLDRRIGALEAVAGYIGANSIDAGTHLVVGSVTTGALAVGAVEAVNIHAGAVQAGHLEAILTVGTTIQTDLANPKVVLNSSGIFGYNSGGAEVFRVNTDTGSVAISGVLTAGAGSALPITYLTSGSLVTGTVFRLDAGGYLETSATNPRVVIDSAGWRSYDASGVLTTEITNSTAIFQGATFRTGPASAARLEMSSTGLRHYTDGTTIASEWSVANGIRFREGSGAVNKLQWTTAAGIVATELWGAPGGVLVTARPTTASDSTGINLQAFRAGSPSGATGIWIGAVEPGGSPGRGILFSIDGTDLAKISPVGLRVGDYQDATYTLDVVGSVGLTGTVFWSGDTNLYRNAAGVLKTDSYLISAIELVARHNGAGQVQIGNAGPAGQAGLQLGSAGDVNLYRLAAGSLASGSHLTVGRFAAAGAAIDASKPVIVGTSTSSGNGAHLTNGGTWTNVSTRDVKDRFRPLTVRRALRSLPLGEWRYRDTDERHIGPTAEDFAAAFGPVGTDPRGLAAMDVAGVALLATQEQDRDLEALRDDLAAIRKGLAPALVGALERLDRRIAAIEARPPVAGGSVKGRG